MNVHSLECIHFTLLFRRGRQRNPLRFKTYNAERLFLLISLLFCGVVVNFPIYEFESAATFHLTLSVF